MEKKKNTSLSWIVVLAVVLILCVGAFFLARGIVTGRSSSLRTAVSTPAIAGQPVYPLKEGFIYYDGATLHALDGRGRQVWTYAVGTGAGFDVGSGGVAAWSGSMLSLLTGDEGRTLFSGNIEDNVLDARMGQLFTAVQIGSEHDGAMLILESGGRKVQQIDLKKQTVLDFGFFNNDSLLWIMALNTEGTLPMCTITTYRPGKMMAGMIKDTQQVLYEVVFQSNKIRAVGTTHIKDFDYTSKEIQENRMLVYGWYLMGMDEDAANPLMVFVPNDQSDGTAGIKDIRLIRGQLDQTMRLPYAANSVSAVDDTVYAFTNQYVMVCRLGEPSPTTYALPRYVESVMGVTENKSAIVSSGGVIFLVPLP